MSRVCVGPTLVDELEGEVASGGVAVRAVDVVHEEAHLLEAQLLVRALPHVVVVEHVEGVVYRSAPPSTPTVNVPGVLVVLEEDTPAREQALGQQQRPGVHVPER